MVTRKRHSYVVDAKAFIDNPSHKDLLQYTSQMPNAQTTVYGNYDVFTRVDSRSTAGHDGWANRRFQASGRRWADT